MNRTVNSTTNSITSPWVESGAMVYVAITVATLSAVIMCCTWFITHNKTIRQWRGRKNKYGVVDDEENIELNAELNGENPFEEEIYKDAKEAIDSQISELSNPTLDDESKVDKEAFTFDDSDGDSRDSGDEDSRDAVVAV